MFLDEDGKPLKRPLYEWGLSSMFRDMNQDGRPDLYVCNDFKSPDRIWINQGKGGFRVLSRSHSGLIALGQARSSVVSDLNGDGRVDIATAQNNEQPKVHLNQTGQAGVRVILLGKGKNPAAVGALIIPIVDGKQGPKREINLGSGCLSQDGRALVFAARGEEAGLLVNWLGSGSGNYKIPKGGKNHYHH